MRGGNNAKKTHCKKGHSLGDAYIRMSDYGTKWRVCRVCQIAQSKAWQAKRKERQAYSFLRPSV